MTPTQIGILVLVFIGLAFLLAVAINRVGGWWKFRKSIAAVEPNIVPVDGFKLHRRVILSPHKSAARPSNVRALARKPVHPKAKDAA